MRGWEKPFSAERSARASVAALGFLSLSGLAWGAWADWNASLDAARLRASEIAQSVDQRTRREITDVFHALRRGERQVTAAWDGRGPVPSHALVDLALPGTPSVNLTIRDAKGRLVYSQAPTTPAINHASTPGFRALAEGETETVSPMVLGPITGKPVVVFARRLNGPSGEFGGVIAIGVRPESLFGPARGDLGLGEGGVAAVVRSDGALVTRFPLLALPADGSPVVVADRWVTAPTTQIGNSPLDGVDRVWATHQSNSQPLTTVVGLSTAELRREWAMRQLRVLGAAMPLLLVMGVVVWRMFTGLRRERESRVALAAALNEREMLLAEVHHRVKNNLQIIQSLLTMESLGASEEARDGYNDSLQRIQAMGMIHELLYRSGDFGAIHVRDYAGRLCELLVGEAEGVQWTVDGDDAILDLDRVVPFAMALNEILSNTLKHAFRGRDSGRLDVGITHRDGRLKVSVADDGVGLPAGFNPATSGNMGTRLLVGLATQLGGDVTFEAAGGTVVRLSFPLAERAVA